MVYIKNKVISLKEVDGYTDTITDEEFNLYIGDSSSYKIENGKFVRLKPESELLGNLLRKRREKECFPIVNRGALWYEKLTAEQKAELSAWYEAWLDAPATGTAPERPTWIDEVTS